MADEGFNRRAVLIGAAAMVLWTVVLELIYFLLGQVGLNVVRAEQAALGGFDPFVIVSFAVLLLPGPIIAGFLSSSGPLGGAIHGIASGAIGFVLLYILLFIEYGAIGVIGADSGGVGFLYLLFIFSVFVVLPLIPIFAVGSLFGGAVGGLAAGLHNQSE